MAGYVFRQFIEKWLVKKKKKNHSETQLFVEDIKKYSSKNRRNM